MILVERLGFDVYLSLDGYKVKCDLPDVKFYIIDYPNDIFKVVDWAELRNGLDSKLVSLLAEPTGTRIRWFYQAHHYYRMESEFNLQPEAYSKKMRYKMASLLDYQPPMKYMLLADIIRGNGHISPTDCGAFIVHAHILFHLRNVMRKTNETWIDANKNLLVTDYNAPAWRELVTLKALTVRDQYVTFTSELIPVLTEVSTESIEAAPKIPNVIYRKSDFKSLYHDTFPLEKDGNVKRPFVLTISRFGRYCFQPGSLILIRWINKEIANRYGYRLDDLAYIRPRYSTSNTPGYFVRDASKRNSTEEFPMELDDVLKACERVGSLSFSQLSSFRDSGNFDIVYLIGPVDKTTIDDAKRVFQTDLTIIEQNDDRQST